MEHSSPSVRSEIDADLARLAKRRARALLLYIAILAGGLSALLFGASRAPSRSLLWFLGLGLIFLAAVSMGAVLMGMPLVKRRVAQSIGLFSFGVVLLGTGMVVDWSAPLTSFSKGAHCFWMGLGFASALILALGILTARLWRRFPNPTLLLAVGTSAVSASILQIKCGATDWAHMFGLHLAPIVVIYLLARLAVWLKERALSAS